MPATSIDDGPVARTADDHEPDPATTRPHAPSPNPVATLVAALALYEVVAVTVNASLDDRVLPSMTGLLGRIRWSGVVRGSLLAVWWAGCWTALGIGVGTIALRSRRAR